MTRATCGWCEDECPSWAVWIGDEPFRSSACADKWEAAGEEGELE